MDAKPKNVKKEESPDLQGFRRVIAEGFEPSTVCLEGSFYLLIFNCLIVFVSK